MSGVISPASPSLALGIQTDEVLHVLVDTEAGVSRELRGHTSDLGSDPASWVATASLVASGVSAGPAPYPWRDRTPDTPYYVAVVTDMDGAGTLELSNVLEIRTAHPRPSAPTVESRGANTARVTCTDESGGAAEHWFYRRRSSDALSELIYEGAIPAGEALDFQYTNLDAAPEEYSFHVVASDGGTRLSRLTTVVDPEPELAASTDAQGVAAVVVNLAGGDLPGEQVSVEVVMDGPLGPVTQTVTYTVPVP